jgi:site-specific recombinase XerD
LTSQTRLFLRFLQWEGIIDADLTRVVPKLPHWRLASIPRHLPWERVRALIDSIDTRTPWGLRDRAVLLLIAMLGIRGAEVLRLRLTDIAWRSSEIYLPQTKAYRARVLPLPHEVGAALSDYILHGRPRVHAPQVILRHDAPIGPLSSPSAVSRIVTRNLRRAAIVAPARSGTHMLRHSLATRLVNRGVPIKQIADLLGHCSIDTTAIYSKVDVTGLTAVALPLPADASW